MYRISWIVRARRVRSCAAALALTVASSMGCDDTTVPTTTPADGGVEFDAQLDPSNASLEVQPLQLPLPGRTRVEVALVGRDLRTDTANETVSIDVALRNMGTQPLHAPATVWLQNFSPSGVHPINADLERMPSDGPGTAPTLPTVAWGFDYSELLGGDAVLAPGETSQSKTWSFAVPGLTPFSFAAQALFGMLPDRPRISGHVFLDANRNARRDPDEGPFSGLLTLVTPNGDVFETRADAQGHYGFPIEAAGLHAVRYRSLLRAGDPQPLPPEPDPNRALTCVTTPNPLQVIVLQGADGQPVGFVAADFGVAFGPCEGPLVPTLVMTNLQPSEIEQDPYDLMEAQLDGDILTLRVGISGCSGEHPFTLYASHGFMESIPVQTWALLAHDDLGEMCDAWFERTLAFDLRPLRAAHVRAYGRPGVVILRFRDFHGNETRFEFGP